MKNEKLAKLARSNAKEAKARAEQERVLDRSWIHVDIDMFYAAA